MREPDQLAKATDMRMEHQWLRAPVSQGKGFNKVWQYPAPSLELEARRVVDLWRGVAGKPWQSLQEAKQHFRKAFSFLDTDADGRVTLAQFVAGLKRLRYPLQEAAAKMIFDQMQTGGGGTAKGYIDFADFASPLLTGPRARVGGPRVWLRHSRLVSFDTSRLPLRQLMSVRHLHDRGGNVHDGIDLKKSACSQPCCVPELNAEGFWGEPVHRGWSALSETTAGEDNMFVSPPFRHNDVPVSRLFECLTPAPLPTDAKHAMLRPVNNYASRDKEPWQAPSVLVSGKELCWKCGGTGGVYFEKGYKRALEESRKTLDGALELVHAAAERSQLCDECKGTGWTACNTHTCVGHRECRNRTAKMVIDTNPAYLPVNRLERKGGAEVGTARLHIIVVQVSKGSISKLLSVHRSGMVGACLSCCVRGRNVRSFRGRRARPPLFSCVRGHNVRSSPLCSYVLISHLSIAPFVDIRCRRGIFQREIYGGEMGDAVSGLSTR